MTKHIIAAAALLLAACSGGAEEEAEGEAPVALVTLAKVEQSALVSQTSVYGAAEPGAMGRLSLIAPAEAIVVGIEAPVGSHVGRGQVVARLAPSPTSRVDLAKAGSDADVANAALARAQRLRADGLASNADVETAAAAARSANLTRSSLGGRNGAMVLRAPAAGVVDSVAAAVGEMLQPGAVVATVAKSGDVRVRFGVDPALARSLRPGMALAIAGSGGRAMLTVPIQAIDPIADPATKLYAVFANVPAASGISVGETLTASIGSGAANATPTIPYAALLDDGGQSFVYVVAGGVAHRREVGLGATAGDRVAVTSGLKPGETVVVEGGTAIEDGMKVRTK